MLTITTAMTIYIFIIMPIAILREDLICELSL